MKHEINELPPF